MLKQRILTALFLIPIVLLMIFYCSAQLFLLLTALLTLLASWEFALLAGFQSKLSRLLYVIFILLSIEGSLFVPIQFILFLAFVWWIFAALMVFLYPNASVWWKNSRVIRALFGVFVLVPAFTGINIIHLQPDGEFILLFLLILIWSADSFAYFTGKVWGKHHLAEAVSPKKSWEGLCGGVVCALIAASIMLSLYSVPFQQWPMILLFSFFTILFSVIGDLFESMLKRQVGVKDASSLLPGHGGLLDRLDSLFAALPVFAFFELIATRS